MIVRARAIGGSRSGLATRRTPLLVPVLRGVGAVACSDAVTADDGGGASGGDVEEVPSEALGLVVVAAVFGAVAVVMWRVGRTEVRLGPVDVVVRRVGPRRVVPLERIVDVRGDERLAHVIVLDTEDGRVSLPRAATSTGSLGADARSREIRDAIAARAGL